MFIILKLIYWFFSELHLLERICTTRTDIDIQPLRPPKKSEFLITVESKLIRGNKFKWKDPSTEAP